MPPPLFDFNRASFTAAIDQVPRCSYCSRELAGSRFEVLDRPACAICACHALAQVPVHNRRVLARSIGVGAVTALAAGLLFDLLLVLPPLADRSGWLIYIAALALGWGIARTMRLASGNAGGRSYQIAGALLTYAAIVLPVQFNLLPTGSINAWFYPLLLLRPVAWLFGPMRSLAAWQLFAAFLGMRVSWTMLRALPTLVRERTTAS